MAVGGGLHQALQQPLRRRAAEAYLDVERGVLKVLDPARRLPASSARYYRQLDDVAGRQVGLVQAAASGERAVACGRPCRPAPTLPSSTRCGELTHEGCDRPPAARTRVQQGASCSGG